MPDYTIPSGWTPEKYAKEKKFKKFFQKYGTWYGNVAGTWKPFGTTAEGGREKARQANIAGVTETKDTLTREEHIARGDYYDPIDGKWVPGPTAKEKEEIKTGYGIDGGDETVGDMFDAGAGVGAGVEGYSIGGKAYKKIDPGVHPKSQLGKGEFGIWGNQIITISPRGNQYGLGEIDPATGGITWRNLSTLQAYETQEPGSTGLDINNLPETVDGWEAVGGEEDEELPGVGVDLGDYDIKTILDSLAAAGTSKADAYKGMLGLQTSLYNTEYTKAGLGAIKDKIAKLDADINTRKADRDRKMLDERGKPIPQWMLSGRLKLEIDSATADINSMIDERNTAAGEYNMGIDEVTRKVEYGVKDAATKYGYWKDEEGRLTDLAKTYYDILTKEVERAEEREEWEAEFALDVEKARAPETYAPGTLEKDYEYYKTQGGTMTLEEFMEQGTKEEAESRIDAYIDSKRGGDGLIAWETYVEAANMWEGSKASFQLKYPPEALMDEGNIARLPSNLKPTGWKEKGRVPGLDDYVKLFQKWKDQNWSKEDTEAQYRAEFKIDEDVDLPALVRKALDQVFKEEEEEDTGGIWGWFKNLAGEWVKVKRGR